MMRRPAANLALDPRFGPRWVADGIEGVEGASGRTAVQRTGQRAESGADDVGEISTGRSDHPRRERRRVEAVIDGEDEVLLERASRRRRRRFTVDHPEVVGGMTERWVAVDRVQPEADAMQRRHDGGHDGGHPQRLGVPVCRCDVDQRPQPELVGGDRQRGADATERGASGAGQRLEDGDHRNGQSAGLADRPLERRELGLSGRSPAATRCHTASKLS